MKIVYHHRKFAGVTNTPNGQVSGDTVFNYFQEGNILRATYSGGSILEGHMLGHVHDDNSLDFVYHHIDQDHNLKGGFCHSIPELLDDGRVRLHETWEWTHGGEGKGDSIVEEIKPS